MTYFSEPETSKVQNHFSNFQNTGMEGLVTIYMSLGHLSFEVTFSAGCYYFLLSVK